jgi:molecular chaperone HscB
MSRIERPDTTNYFKFYGLEQSFKLDPAQLKSSFLQKSKEFHPDFHTNDPEAQNIALAVSAFNNKAYKILGNEISRAQYLVDLHLDNPDEKQQLPQDFLMEMMDLNEAIDELASANNDSQKEKLSADIRQMKDQIQSEIRDSAQEAKWSETQMSLLKWKYLERLENRVAVNG